MPRRPRLSWHLPLEVTRPGTEGVLWTQPAVLATVERRRRDKINNWIVQLSKIIPDCNADNSKTGASKGGILSKACDYIRELRQTNQRMQETFKEAERLQMDNELLRQQIEELKNENAVLRAQLQQHNLEMVGESARQ